MLHCLHYTAVFNSAICQTISRSFVGELVCRCVGEFACLWVGLSSDFGLLVRWLSVSCFSSSMVSNFLQLGPVSSLAVSATGIFWSCSVSLSWKLFSMPGTCINCTRSRGVVTAVKPVQVEQVRRPERSQVPRWGLFCLKSLYFFSSKYYSTA